MINNDVTQPLGTPLPNWHKCELPPRKILNGQYCTVNPFSLEKHTAKLFAAYATDKRNLIWSYLPFGPYDNLVEYTRAVEVRFFGNDPKAYVIIDQQSKQVLGQALFMNIDPANGCIEIGGVIFTCIAKISSGHRSHVSYDAVYI